MKLLASFALVLTACPPAPAAEAKKLAVHEWGVFRVHEDAEMANADLRALWDNLPEFVYGHIRGRLVPQHWGAIEIRDRPVIFFHAPEPTQVRLMVQFPGGAAGVWWPGTEAPAVYGMQKQPQPGRTLQWTLGVKQAPPGWQPRTPAPREVPKGHWFNRLREVKCDEVFARFGPGGQYIDREKFVYYDGIFPQGKWLKFDVDKQNVSITSRVKHPVFDVTVIDRRGDGKVRIARFDKLAAGQSVRNLAFTERETSRYADAAAARLATQLAAAGLNEDEARSLVDLWKKDFFETPGLHAFYRLPQAEYDRLLPLQVAPQFDGDDKKDVALKIDLVRIGLVFHAHLEPDLAERVLELVKQLDADTFAQRDAARRKLLAVGPAALVHLQHLKKTSLSTEVQKQVEALIKQWGAKEALE